MECLFLMSYLKSLVTLRVVFVEIRNSLNALEVVKYSEMFVRAVDRIAV